MRFNKAGRLMRRNFYLGNTKLENVRSYKYLGLKITPSGEIKSALDDLRSRALKAYMALKNKLGVSFREHLDDTIGFFDSLVRPILLYGSDFWGALKCQEIILSKTSICNFPDRSLECKKIRPLMESY